MIVICPRCSTPYALPADAIGQAGRLVRCSTCGHEWEQRLVEAEASGNAAVTPNVSEAQPASPLPAPQSAAPETSEPPRAEATAASLDGDDTISRQSEPELTDAERPASSDSDDAATGDEDTIDFADDPPLPTPTEDESATPLIEPEREVEPMIDAPAEENPSARKHWIVGAVAAGATLLLLGGGAVAFQKSIVAAIPATQGLFAMFESTPPLPGIDLEIRDVSTSRELSGIHEVIVVRGSVANSSDEARLVPPLRISLVDAEDQALKTTVVAAAQESVVAQGMVSFEATLGDPGDQARNLKIAFAAPDEASDNRGMNYRDHGNGRGSNEAQPPDGQGSGH